MADSSQPQVKKSSFWSFAVAAIACVFLYSIHLNACEQSSLRFLDDFFLNSDMHANLMWARGIREQGWLNPVPHHPWNDWMQAIGPYGQWVSWWGGEQIFQQSPLYAYFLSAFLPHYFLIRVLQALMSIGTWVFIGLLAARLAGRTAGWIAFWLAALYAPFYAYSWPFLRDGLGWFLTAAAVWTLTVLTDTEWSSRRAQLLGWTAGVLLGLGFLARETYLLLIPLTWFVLGFLAWKRQHWGIVVRVVIGTILAISPLLIRNRAVGAPLLSTSNRFVESFITGNAYTAHPYLNVIPMEMGQILYQTHAQAIPVIRATIASRPDGIRGWLNLQGQKLLSLLDPFEPPDNLSIYFVATVSPVVRFGLRYWMILVPGLAGLALSVWRRDRAHLWLWIYLPVIFLSLLVGVPLSRYRQGLAIFFIPYAACFFVFLWAQVHHKQFFKAAWLGAVIFVGWGLVLGPFSRRPRAQYERPVEYMLSAMIFHQLGDEQKCNAMFDLVRRKFPGLLPPQSGPVEDNPH